jgi:multidrug efflux pump subunit AcrA (membrane-fusion protein)
VVGNTQENEISADLDSDEMEKLEEGMRVSVALVNRPGEAVTGFIRQVPYPYGGGAAQGEVEEDQSVRISLDVSTGEAGYELGDLVRVTVVLEHKENVLWLPPQAIRTFEGRKFVVVQDGEYQQRVDVKIGIQGEDRIEILEGLTEGQEVIGP